MGVERLHHLAWVKHGKWIQAPYLDLHSSSAGVMSDGLAGRLAHHPVGDMGEDRIGSIEVSICDRCVH